MSTTDEVIAKIQKLLNLAARAGTEAEAEVATTMAQGLLAKYNLEMYEVEATRPSSSPKQENKRIKDQHSRSALFAYQRKLWEGVASANFCWYSAVPEYKVNALGVHMIVNYRHQFIGSEVNVMATRVMGDYLESALARICPYKSGKEVTLFKEGAANRLVDRLDQRKREMLRESEEKQRNAATSTGTGIVLASVYLNEDDENYRFVHGEKSYQDRLWYRHDHESCSCDRCVKYRERTKEYRERQEVVVAKPEESPAEKARREKREAKERERDKRNNERWNEKYYRQQFKRRAKELHPAFQAGESRANDIGLDPQLNQGNRKGINE